MKRSLLTVLFVAVCAFAADKPDFSGTWKLNIAKSDFGPFPPPAAVTSTIKHAEPNVEIASKITTAQGDAENKSTYTTDGKECVNTDRGNTIKSTLNWDAAILVVNAKLSVSGNELAITDRWALSADGKVITRERHYASPQGEVDAKWIYDKQ